MLCTLLLDIQTLQASRFISPATQMASRMTIPSISSSYQYDAKNTSSNTKNSSQFTHQTSLPPYNPTRLTQRVESAPKSTQSSNLKINFQLPEEVLSTTQQNVISTRSLFGIDTLKMQEENPKIKTSPTESQKSTTAPINYKKLSSMDMIRLQQQVRPDFTQSNVIAPHEKNQESQPIQALPDISDLLVEQQAALDKVKISIEKENVPFYSVDHENPVDIAEIYINQGVGQGSKIIDTWLNDYSDSSSNIYIQENLKDDILQGLKLTDTKSKYESLQALEQDFIIIEKLIEKYKKQPDVQIVLQNIDNLMQSFTQSQKIAPKQANLIINRSYTPALRQQILLLIPTQPTFDYKGSMTNMPSIESILHEAKINPTQKAYDALQACNKAILIAQYASRNDKSFIAGQSQILTQLKSFEKDVATALQNPLIAKFKPSSYLPSAEQVLDQTGLGTIKISTIINTGKKTIDTLNRSIDTINAYTPSTYTIPKINATNVLQATGIADMSVSQMAQKTGIIPSETFIEKDPIKFQPRSAKEYFMPASDVHDQHALQDQNLAKQAISQYCTPAMLADIFTLISSNPIFNRQDGTVINMPSIESIIDRQFNSETRHFA